jgi:orotidine-5'-phosphate decarboxylase
MMSGGFHHRLRAVWESQDSQLCVGLDPDPARFPAHLGAHTTGTTADAILRFCIEIVDATADLVCAFKPQIAHFAAQRAEGVLEEICQHIRREHPQVVLILDAKRGDIGSTAEFYAVEAFDRYLADAVTVNPYLGTDAARPLLERGGVIALCRTSNAGSAEVQDLDVHGRPLHLHVAEMVAQRWSEWGDCALVVGATYPDQLRAVRNIVEDLPVLVPGIGAQGGDLEASVVAGLDSTSRGLMISSSRQILYRSDGEDFAAAARREAEITRTAINQAATSTSP